MRISMMRNHLELTVPPRPACNLSPFDLPHPDPGLPHRPPVAAPVNTSSNHRAVVFQASQRDIPGTRRWARRVGVSFFFFVVLYCWLALRGCVPVVWWWHRQTPWEGRSVGGQRIQVKTQLWPDGALFMRCKPGWLEIIYEQSRRPAQLRLPMVPQATASPSSISHHSTPPHNPEGVSIISAAAAI